MNVSKGTTMDHVTPLYPASKFASAYCDMQDGERNLLYLFGLAGLLALVERENAAVPGRHTLDVHAVASVVRAWADCESDTWTGGFVLELNDGSRVYLEGFESDGWGPHSAASVVPMPAGNDLPRPVEQPLRKPVRVARGPARACRVPAPRWCIAALHDLARGVEPC
jgi:hypothetical protein